MVNQRIGTEMEVPNMNMITPAMKRQLMAMSGITDMKEFDEIISKLGRAQIGYLIGQVLFPKWIFLPFNISLLP